MFHSRTDKERRWRGASRIGTIAVLGLLIAWPAAAELPVERIWQTAGNIRDLQVQGEVIAWMEDIDTPTGSKTDIYFWNGTSVHQVTQLPLLYAINSEMALDGGQLAWFAVNEEDPPPPFGAWLYLFDGTENRKLGPVCRRMPAGGNLLEVAKHGRQIIYTGTAVCDDPGDDVEIFLWDGTQTTQYTNTDYLDEAAWHCSSQICEMELKFCNGVPYWIDRLPCIGLSVRNWIIGREGGGNNLGHVPAMSVADYQGWGGGYEAWIEYSDSCLWAPGKIGTVVFSDLLYEIRLPCHGQDYPGNLQLEGQRLIWDVVKLESDPFPPFGVYAYDRAGKRMISAPDVHMPYHGAPVMDGERIVYGYAYLPPEPTPGSGAAGALGAGSSRAAAGGGDRGDLDRIMLNVSGMSTDLGPGWFPTLDGPHIAWLRLEGGLEGIYHGVEPSEGTVQIDCSHSHVTPGQQFRVALDFANSSRACRADWLFSIEAGGQVLYFPDWGPEPRPQALTLPEGESREVVIFDLVWPAGAGAMDDLAFGASLLWHDSPFVIDEDRFEWSFGPAKGGDR